MWAFVMVDPRQRTATLVRDRFGIKPLYWTRQVELKAFREVPSLALEPNRATLRRYLVSGAVDDTPYAG